MKHQIDETDGNIDRHINPDNSRDGKLITALERLREGLNTIDRCIEDEEWDGVEETREIADLNRLPEDYFTAEIIRVISHAGTGGKSRIKSSVCGLNAAGLSNRPAKL
jgi:hypothetical protein